MSAGKPILLLLVVASLACRTHGAAPAAAPSGGQVITAGQIARSGARNAWEALQKFASQFSFQERSGRATGMRYRGKSSILLTESPLVVVDGAEVSDFRVLQDIPAADIDELRVLSSTDGATFYGLRAGSGVILIRTQQATPPAHGTGSRATTAR
ncbi:MAG: TonB-dependent receptor plug domain-containing protein [Gemmatimonadetes bacterium]|nr:TonB-dependent receptor plug domain-containing protein [Gemmatimonadota bacterium]